jgi:heme/copper-type cytochrome/quinol oxidase subunit 2
VWIRRGARALLAVGAGSALVAATGPAVAGESILDQVNPLLWTMIWISVAGAALVYAILAYAVWKFRDPATKGRRYG